MSGNTKTNVATAKASPVWGATVTNVGTWSNSANFGSADKTVATKWAANANKFSCTKADGSGSSTTDCNKLLMIPTGGCCAKVDGTKPKTLTTGFTNQTATIIDSAWPVNGGTKYLCATQESLTKVAGFSDTTANSTAGIWGAVDAATRFQGKTAKRTSLTGSVATWTCSGATALAASGAVAAAFISLM